MPENKILIEEPKANYYSIDKREGARNDPPAIDDNIKNLFTLPYAKLIDVISNILFPPNTIETTNGGTIKLLASDARIDRFIYFRSVWDVEFGEETYFAFRDLTQLSIAFQSIHFLGLSVDQQVGFIEKLEKGEIPPNSTLIDESRQKNIFRTIHSAITEGLFSEPGYGGNDKGLGWYYSNYMSLEGNRGE